MNEEILVRVGQRKYCGMLEWQGLMRVVCDGEWKTMRMTAVCTRSWGNPTIMTPDPD